MKSLSTFFAITIYLLVVAIPAATAQNIAINSTGTTADASAILDVQSANKGMLIPQINLSSLTSATEIPSPAASLLVYNTNAALTGGKGYYYNSGTSGAPVWTKLVASGTDWKLAGNSGTAAGTDFIGTTDATGLLVKTNGSTRIDVSSDGITKIGGTTDHSKFEADGTYVMEGAATVWDDINVFPDATTKNGSNPPSWGSTFKNNGSGSQGVVLWMFSSGTEQELYFSIQIPHKYKVGTALLPHVHWTTASGTPSGTNVAWGLEYSGTAIGGIYGPTTTIITAASVIPAITISGTGQHLITALGSISGTNLGISSVIICRLFRQTGNASDTFSNEVGFLGVDFHYEIDTEGSRTEFTK